jgi:hypothetical protein
MDLLFGIKIEGGEVKVEDLIKVAEESKANREGLVL